MNDLLHNKFRVRSVDAEDPKTWALIVQMDHECFGYDAPALTDNSGAWWIVYSEGTPAAYCAIKPSSNSEHGGYLSRAGVLEQFRGCGLQKKLIKQRLAYAKKQGWNWVVTDTCENAASGNSLIACGFRLFKPEYPWSFTHACYWKKFLLPKKKSES